MTDEEKLQEAVILLRNLVTACTKGPNCLVCGEVFDSPDMEDLSEYDLYTAELWLDAYFPEPEEGGSE